MSIFKRIRKSATQAVDQHGDKISRGLDKAAKSVDDRTGHKHSGKIRKGVGKAKEGLSRLETKHDRGDQPPGGPPGTPPPDSGPSGPPDTGSTPPR